MSEDINVERLLDVFTTVDAKSDDVWRACANFMQHPYWHKTRPTVLRPKIEALPNDHPWKLICVQRLSQLFVSAAKRLESLSLQLPTRPVEPTIYLEIAKLLRG